MTSGGKTLITDLDETGVMLSPVANLAADLCGTSLSSTPCFRLTARRLSMSNLTPGTPTDNGSLCESFDSKCGTPRLSKNVLRSQNGRVSFFRRMNSAPATSLVDSDMGQDGNKENTRRALVLSPLKCSSISSSPLRGRPIEKHDSNSRDSGYAAEETSFRFTEPCGFAPKKSGDSPKKLLDENTISSKSPIQSIGRGRFSALSFGSVGSFDDGFLELGDLDKSFPDENEELPAGLGNLLKGPLLSNTSKDEDSDKNSSFNRPPLRRFNSMVDTYTSPASSKVRVGLFSDDPYSPNDSTPTEKIPFKRPREIETNSTKRRKSNSLQVISENPTKEPPQSRYKLQRSISETAASSLSMMLHKTDLIADFTRPYALPIVCGRHEDLKSITSDTLANLLNGDFNSKVDSFKIIDCRYPYEYEGGHIKGSINLYTKEQVEQELFGNRTAQDCDSPGETKKDERNILIFHCEFSLERGPALYRFLRRCDRNLSSYPSLQYPEVYLLHGGYESFFSTHKSLCEPCSYQPMVDPKHENDLRKFRVKSNSWSGDLKRQAAKSGLKRLGLF